jgi:hypothetical protein
MVPRRPRQAIAEHFRKTSFSPLIAINTLVLKYSLGFGPETIQGIAIMNGNPADGLVKPVLFVFNSVF